MSVTIYPIGVLNKTLPKKLQFLLSTSLSCIFLIITRDQRARDEPISPKLKAKILLHE